MVTISILIKCKDKDFFPKHKFFQQLFFWQTHKELNNNNLHFSIFLTFLQFATQNKKKFVRMRKND